MKFLLLYPVALLLLTTSGKTTPIDFLADGFSRVVPTYTKPTLATVIQDKGTYNAPISSFESERLAETRAELELLNSEYSVLEEKLESTLADVAKLVKEKIDLTFGLKMIRRKFKDVKEKLNAQKLPPLNRQG